MVASDRETRQAHLVNALRRSQVPVAARSLAEQVGVSPRTVRDYVAALNEGLDRPVVVSDQRGYRLDEQVYWRLRSAQATKQMRVDTPRRRLMALLRHLARRGEGDMFALAERFHVSEPTLEADLARVGAIRAGIARRRRPAHRRRRPSSHGRRTHGHRRNTRRRRAGAAVRVPAREHARAARRRHPRS